MDDTPDWVKRENAKKKADAAEQAARDQRTLEVSAMISAQGTDVWQRFVKVLKLNTDALSTLEGEELSREHLSSGDRELPSERDAGTTSESTVQISLAGTSTMRPQGFGSSYWGNLNSFFISARLAAMAKSVLAMATTSCPQKRWRRRPSRKCANGQELPPLRRYPDERAATQCSSKDAGREPRRWGFVLPHSLHPRPTPRSPSLVARNGTRLSRAGPVSICARGVHTSGKERDLDASKKEQSVFPDFSWYREWSERAKSDILLRWLNDARTDFVKRQALAPRSLLQMRCIDNPRQKRYLDDEDCDGPYIFKVNPFECTHFYIGTGPWTDHPQLSLHGTGRWMGWPWSS